MVEGGITLPLNADLLSPRASGGCEGRSPGRV
jgi:hypothetical protein